jgi:hypothetical protein
MKGIIELPIDTDSESVNEMESSALETILEIYREQQETNRLALTTLKDMVETLVKAMEKDNNASRKNEHARIQLEKDRLQWEKEQYALSRTRQCESAKDLEKLSKATLASKSGSASKSKVKSGSGARKKTT